MKNKKQKMFLKVLFSTEPTTEGSVTSSDRNELPSPSPKRSRGPFMNDETPSNVTAPKPNLKGAFNRNILLNFCNDLLHFICMYM